MNPSGALRQTHAARAEDHHGSGPGFDAAAELDVVLRAGLLRTAFQPIVDIDSRLPVAFEALARGPEGSPLHRPDALFAAARSVGRLAELDRACQLAALRSAEDAGLGTGWTLFLNTEPEAAGTRRPPTLGGQRGHAVVVELTERALTARPAELLRMVDLLRSRGWGIALDDVGADPASLALLPLVRPDVVKLDLRLVQAQPDAQIAAIVNAVSAQAERDGTLVLAEGIETEEQRATAVAFGASLGQGWLFGRPEPLPATVTRPPADTITLSPRRRLDSGRTPFEVGARRRPVRVATKPLLIQMSKQLEQQARGNGDACVVVSTFQDAANFTPATRVRYADIAATATFVAALGHGMADEPLPGVRGASIDASDPLALEWAVTVLGPHFAGALLARDLGDTGPDAQRRFEFVITHDRDLVVAAASALLTRVAPLRALEPVREPTAPSPAPLSASHPAVPAPRPPVHELASRSGLLARLQTAVDAGRTRGVGAVLLLVAVETEDGTPQRLHAPRALDRRLRAAVRSQDVTLELAPGLHALVLVDVFPGQAEAVAERVSDSVLLALEAATGDASPRVLVSIGASLSPDRASSADEALGQAEDALLLARAAGGDCARIWRRSR
ncbi:EAL domain-containing protein (putative c-di-GMP-specific phosphodiesterase class I) [Kineococcus xinjiangensis]|uniref:EAL domain-containing protein (Putative c-di-GMP-specific phosphodiesterase class I) n=1 Tax=Kineococcus xinjiangensis TaxID=512762 RepID=A0A2S6ITS4_9ACTN|nr:EAL domain-containing protein [Kineococcus xinjiangensis]PPK97456.1 EAL domain-containing protein (putative c-di-GMP-specific phosphodiesterase class I) [Kineococcus xinjiangensis]